MAKHCWTARLSLAIIAPLLLLGVITLRYTPLKVHFRVAFLKAPDAQLLSPPEPLGNYTDYKYILGWSRTFFGIDYSWTPGDKGFRMAKCPQPHCYLTENRSLLKSVSDFDAILFHQRTFNLAQDKPIMRRSGQRYVHWTSESPAHLHWDVTRLEAMNGFFNWSMSYRLDSTYPVPYGSVVQTKHHSTGPALEELIRQFGENNVHLAKKGSKPMETENFAVTSPPAAWFVSNYQSKSGREEFVKKIEQFVEVDVYGPSNKLKCGGPEINMVQNDTTCLELLNSTYKLYLSLENSLCQDYLTEKFWKVLSYNVIPVVLNGANMTKYAPHHSYVDIKDFSNFTEFGNYLVRLTKEPALFSSYFWWRDYYTVPPCFPVSQCVSSGYKDAMCDLCAALHDPTTPEATIADLTGWWAGEGVCRNPPEDYTPTSNAFDKEWWGSMQN